MIAYGQRPASLEGATEGCADQPLRREPGCSLRVVVDHKGSRCVTAILSLQALGRCS